jgi:radical SAM-linked protein
MDGRLLARYRAEFHKTEAMRFTGNLDLHRTFERTLRRAGLPLAYTQGFHPHPRLTLASALSLGCTSEGELAEFWLESALPPEEVRTACRRASPSGIVVVDVVPVPIEEAALPTLVRSAEYRAELDPEDTPPDLEARLEALLQSETLPRSRRDKAYDLRPLVEDLRASRTAEGPAELWMRLTCLEGATGRPDEVLLALGIEPSLARIHRLRLLFADPVAR